MAGTPPRLLAEFGSADALLDAARALRAAGVRDIETYTPHEIKELSAVLDLPRSWIPKATCIAGVLGGVTGYVIQWYTNAVSFPLDAGGRPAHAIPSFIFVTWETLVFVGSIVAFICLFVAGRLPRLWDPIDEVDGFERASIDRFWLAVRLDDAGQPATLARTVLEPRQPLRLVHREAVR